MARSSGQEFEQRLRQRFGDFVTSQRCVPVALIETARTIRERGWTAFVFGGIPRGVFEDGNRYRPRDLDLVFDDEHFPSFESAFEQYIVKRNNYGGLRLHVKSLQVDAWPLSATWAFRAGYAGSPSFQGLPSTTFLNVDGIVVEMIPKKGKPRRVYEDGFFSAWGDRVLDINLAENPFPCICVARTLHIAKLFCLRLSQRLAEYVWRLLSTTPAVDFLHAQECHYGRVDFDARRLLEIYRRLDWHLSDKRHAPIALFPAQSDLPLDANVQQPAPSADDQSILNPTTVRVSRTADGPRTQLDFEACDSCSALVYA